VIAKGSTILTTLDFVRREAGDAACDRALARLAPAERARVAAVSPTDEAPLDLAVALWRAVDAELGPTDPSWSERAGAHAIASAGQQLYSGILRKASPDQFLTQGVSLFRLYYHPGNMEVVEQAPGRVVLRLVGFDVTDPLFCRRQTGGLRQALAIAGGEHATSRHVRCTQEGDAFCEWELGWG
jgi:hypothetical protein